MSFYCKKCSLVQKGIKQSRITTKIRKVKYAFRNIYISKVMDEKLGIPKNVLSAPKTVKETNGFEIVEQDIYCAKCAPQNIEPETVDSVIRYLDRTVYKRNKERNRRRNY